MTDPTPFATFTGVEAEGRLRGVPTLFVRGFDYEKVEDLLQHTPHAHVMFGAKGSILDHTELCGLQALLPHKRPGLLVTLHHPLDQADIIPATLASRVHLLLYLSSDIAPLLTGDVEVKIENETHAMIYGSPHAVPLAYLYDAPTPDSPAAAR